MSAVLGYAQLLMRDDSLSESQRRKIESILSGATHLLTVINDVLEMSKIEAGRTKLALAATDPGGRATGGRAMTLEPKPTAAPNDPVPAGAPKPMV